MEKETKYGIIEQVGPQFPVRKLLVVRHRGGDLTVSYPAFGPNTYKGNLEEMSKDYSHPQTGERISFREPTTAESISAAAWNFKDRPHHRKFPVGGFVPRNLSSAYSGRS